MKNKFNKKRFLIFVAIALIIVNIIAYFVGSYLYPKKIDKLDFKLRVGIPPALSEKYNRGKWDKYFKYIKSKGINFIPCYTKTYDDAIQGFLHNSLDLIYVNPIIYLQLTKNKSIDTKECLVEKLFMHDLEEKDKTGNRAVLISLKKSPINFISSTKNKRITFTDKNSMFGYIIPQNFLKKNINEKLDDWFEQIDFSITKDQALMNLIRGDTDIIAIDALTLRNLLDEKGLDEKIIHIVWLSQTFPSHVLCINKNYEHKKELKKILMDAISFYNKNIKNKKIILHEPNYSYRKELESLTQYLGDTND